MTAFRATYRDSRGVSKERPFVMSHLECRREQTAAARKAFRASFRTSEERSDFYRRIARREHSLAQVGRVVIEAYERLTKNEDGADGGVS